VNEILPNPDESAATAESWRLFRLDDNGNRFLVARFAKRADAEAEARLYEARGHKQVYCVESDYQGSIG
jgi:hypothetical protein